MTSLGNAVRTVHRAWREGRTDAVAHMAGYRAWRTTLQELGIASVEGLRVLDIGCGDRCQLSLLFAADGAIVTAVDIQPVQLGLRRPLMWALIAREEGVEPAARLVVRDIVHTARYWRNLRRGTEAKRRRGRIRLLRSDAASLPLPDSSFDIVVSSAVWEHLPDIEQATREVARVLTDTGIAVIQVALFPALQGGHHAEWHSVERGVDRAIGPWDHLLPCRAPVPTYLNEMRESQYKDVFERALTVIRWEDGELRGEDYLTDDLVRQLASYSRRDLLLSSVTAWAKKPATLHLDVRKGPNE